MGRLRLQEGLSMGFLWEEVEWWGEGECVKVMT